MNADHHAKLRAAAVCDAAAAIDAADAAQFGGLQKAVRNLARCCGGLLPPIVSERWKAVRAEMEIAGEVGLGVPGELHSALGALSSAVLGYFGTGYETARALPTTAHRQPPIPLQIYRPDDEEPAEHIPGKDQYERKEESD